MALTEGEGMFRDPIWFLALAVPLAILWGSRIVGRPSLRFPSCEGLQDLVRRSHPGWLKVTWILRAAALLFIVVAMARPRSGLESSRIITEGIDIVLAVDVSTSMLAEDFKLGGTRRNRLAVVKNVVRDFIEARPNDRIGLVVFAGRPYTQCPLTLDHGWLLTQLERTKIGMVEDGTAIGSGIATALNRLRESKAKSRVIVLLTDGVNNAGTVTPQAAAELAKALDVRVYTIGAGTRGVAPYPARDIFGRKVYQQIKVEIDEDVLTMIAKETHGRYFRATDTESLKQTYHEIDRMEKVTIEQPQYMHYKEWYPWWVTPAIILLLAEIVLGQVWLMVLP